MPQVWSRQTEGGIIERMCYTSTALGYMGRLRKQWPARDVERIPRRAEELARLVNASEVRMIHLETAAREYPHLQDAVARSDVKRGKIPGLI
jgi:hypothetical protein